MKLSEELQERIDLINHKLKFNEQKPTVACIINLDPLMLTDVDLAQLVSLAGGAPVIGDADSLHQQDPDAIIIMPQGFAIEESMKNIDLLLQVPGFTELKAVKNNRLYIVDSNKFEDTAEENIVDCVELLAEIINPKQFIFGHEGEGWIKFSL